MPLDPLDALAEGSQKGASREPSQHGSGAQAATAAGAEAATAADAQAATAAPAATQG